MREIYSVPSKMKQIAGFTGSFLLSGYMFFPGAGSAAPISGSVRDSYPASAWGKCDPDLWEHVHGADLDGVPGPDRLQIIKPCITVSGTIEKVEAEADGDYHVLLKPDPKHFDILLDPRFKGNIDFQDGNLVTEPVCASEIRDNNVAREGVCDDFSQDFDVEVGDHVEMSGSYVSDINHGGWLEIHPITSIVER